MEVTLGEIPIRQEGNCHLPRGMTDSPKLDTFHDSDGESGQSSCPDHVFFQDS